MKRVKLPPAEISVHTLEQERKVLLELGNDITSVREKTTFSPFLNNESKVYFTLVIRLLH